MSNNTDILNQLKEKTKENIKSLLAKGIIYSDDKLEKQYIQNHSMVYTLNSIKKAIPLNIIYHSIYNQDYLCQSSNGKLNFNRNIFSTRKDYDIVYDKKSFNNHNAPKYYKIPIEQAVSSLIENKSIKEEIDDLDNYPKIFEFKYVYQHPIPNPSFMGPKLLKNTDQYKIIFISPICLIIEQKGTSEGFTGIDSFYSAIRFKFDTEINPSDLTIKKTILNVHFGLNFTKSNWLQGKIKSAAYQQAEEGFSQKYLPNIEKELNLTIKKFSKDLNKGKKIEIKDKKISSNDKSMTLDDIILNDSFISDIEDEKNNNGINNNNINQGIKNNFINNYLLIYVIIGFLAGIFLVEYINKDFIVLILLGLIVYNLFSINAKLDQLCKNKNL